MQIRTNFSNVITEFKGNIIENISGFSEGINEIKIVENGKYLNWSYDPLKLTATYQNRGFVLLSLLAFLLNITIYRKKISIPSMISFGAIFYIVFTSGVSFWQGDRFNMVFYPIAIIVIFKSLTLNTKVQSWLSK